MKAVLSPKSGPPEVLQIADVPKPEPAEDELLIKVACATITSGDVKLRSMPRWLLKTLGALFGFKPMEIAGVEYSGEIVMIGSKVESWTVGQSVCGTTTGLQYGANAEYVCVPAAPKTGVIAEKPEAVSFADAAAVPVGSMTAIQLLKPDRIKPGSRVLIYGASGSVGSFALQLAKISGAEITAVCSGANIDMAKGLGADHVLDYKTEAVPPAGATFDLIFDAVGKAPKKACKQSLARGGRFTSIRRPTKEISAEFEHALSLVASGNLQVIIDRELTLSEVAEGHRYVESGRKRGNIVVRIAS
jgi:NADPH:quinone reductase-like Zn-dependent oxidoreductase